MYKCVNSELPPVFSDYFSYDYECHNHNTLSSLNLHILPSKQVLYSFSIVNTGPKLRNR